MPAPLPVPRITAKTTPAPAPAPSVASDNARQLASLATRTACPSNASRSRLKGRPFSEVELLFFINPCDVRLPGVPRPIVQGDVPLPLAARVRQVRRRLQHGVATVGGRRTRDRH
jgi:hypothetical protein